MNRLLSQSRYLSNINSSFSSQHRSKWWCILQFITPHLQKRIFKNWKNKMLNIKHSLSVVPNWFETFIKQKSSLRHPVLSEVGARAWPHTEGGGRLDYDGRSCLDTLYIFCIYIVFHKSPSNSVTQENAATLWLWNITFHHFRWTVPLSYPIAGYIK